MDRRANKALLALASLCGLSWSCKHVTAPSLPTGQPLQQTTFTALTTDTRFNTANNFLAAIEMQISGEPFAQLLGRNLAGYSRFRKVPDIYVDPVLAIKYVDPMSYSMAVESYEYSKQPMNNTSFESGAGLALAYGSILNPNQSVGDDNYNLLVNRLQHFADTSSTSGLAGSNWVTSPAPTDNPFNIYGWPGYWPVFAEFRSFKPDIEPAGGAAHGCAFTFGYGMPQGTLVGDYECSYDTLNLPKRELQVEKVLEPAALGFAMWKQGLWVINYWQSMHDYGGNPIVTVADVDLPFVGQPNNTVVGQFPDPNDPTGQAMLQGVAGTFLGDVPLEGWQGLTMLDEMDNKSALLLSRLLTSDGTTLGGFASTREAIGYDETKPLRFWPNAIAVTEVQPMGFPAPPAGQSWKYFPQPTTYAIQTPTSSLWDLAALVGGAAEFFALSDANNPNVGGTSSSLATFDGDPFPSDNQLPDGEESPHDRALATIKVAVVNMSRMHYDAVNKVLVDQASFSSGATGNVKLSSTVSTVTAGYAIVAIRTALRSISSTLSLYSNDTPDTIGLPTALDAAPLCCNAAISDRMRQLITAQADFMVNHLIAADGSVANSYDVASNKPDPTPSRLESESSAIRGLFDAYLATSDVKYEQAAMRVWADLERRFWMTDARAYRTTAGIDDTLTYSPVVFATLQGALRQYWKLVGNRPGNQRLGSEILERVQRMNKLIANGWDDVNADNVVQYPSECTGASLQMAERALTGELSHEEDHGDRDNDCVKEISVAFLPSALAAQVVLTRRYPAPKSP